MKLPENCSLGMMSTSLNDKTSPPRQWSIEKKKRTLSVDQKEEEIYKLFNPDDMVFRE